MIVEEAIALVEQLLERGCLTKVQELVFRKSWTGQTYLDMAVDSDYDPGHIKDVGSELWRSLSKALGEKVTKNNLHRVLEQTAQRQIGERNNIAGYTEILAGLKFEKDIIMLFFPQDIIQRLVIDQDILQKVEKQEALKWITSFLNYRFGEVNPSLRENFQELSLQELEVLRDVLFDFSTLADLEVWLKQQKD
ncbi:DUF4351 domain-containing protein [Anabaena azotica]|uniref:DUF4351 domain-containing protein n=1 Tax=Anabaena azotica TaxID=197653 RepID=UPI0039A5EAA2